MAKILIYWANLGFSFRLDALPFLGKPPYKLCDIRHEPSHLIIQALRYLAKYINPNCMLLAETYESMSTIKEYFGTDQDKQFDLSYNFHLCSNLWVSVVKKSNQPIWHILQEMRHIPQHAAWLNFLRNHDELSLAHLDPESVKKVKDELLEFGLSFREGYGISGRTFSLLNHHAERYKMIYFLLASLPYAIMITYGDEIGKENVAFDSLSPEEQQDTRHINRGEISQDEILAANQHPMFQFLAALFHQRLLYADFLSQIPQQLPTPSNLFAAVYPHNGKMLYVYINLTAEQQAITLPVLAVTMITCVNTAVIENGEINLGGYGGIWLLAL